MTIDQVTYYAPRVPKVDAIHWRDYYLAKMDDDESFSDAYQIWCDVVEMQKPKRRRGSPVKTRRPDMRPREHLEAEKPMNEFPKMWHIETDRSGPIEEVKIVSRDNTVSLTVTTCDPAYQQLVAQRVLAILDQQQCVTKV